MIAKTPNMMTPAMIIDLLIIAIEITIVMSQTEVKAIIAETIEVTISEINGATAPNNTLARES